MSDEGMLPGLQAAASLPHISSCGREGSHVSSCLIFVCLSICLCGVLVVTVRSFVVACELLVP